MNATPPKDELLERYAQAKAALPDGLPSEPSAALRERILASAREQVSAIKNVAPLAVSTPAIALKSIKESVENKTTPTEAANDSFWNIRAFASIAVMGLAGLLWWQFEQGTPEEQLAAKSAQPSAAAAKAEVATPPMPDAPTPTPTPAPASSASTAADALIAPEPQSQAKIMAKKSAPLFESEKSAAQKESTVTPAPESARVRAEEAAPVIAAAPTTAPAAAPAAAPSPAPAPAARAAQQSSKAAADGLANTAPAPSADYTAAQSVQAPPPQSRVALPAAPRAAAPIPPAAAPAPSAPPSSAFTRANFIAAIFAKDALTLRQALAQGVSPNVMTPAGNPALTQAVIERWPEGVRILLAAGADRSSKNSKGHTAADVALELGFEDMSRLLEAPR